MVDKFIVQITARRSGGVGLAKQDGGNPPYPQERPYSANTVGKLQNMILNKLLL